MSKTHVICGHPGASSRQKRPKTGSSQSKRFGPSQVALGVLAPGRPASFPHSVSGSVGLGLVLPGAFQVQDQEHVALLLGTCAGPSGPVVGWAGCACQAGAVRRVGQERPRSCICPASGQCGVARPTRRSGAPCGTHPLTCKRTSSLQGWLGGLSATTAPTQWPGEEVVIHMSCGH